MWIYFILTAFCRSVSVFLCASETKNIYICTLRTLVQRNKSDTHIQNTAFQGLRSVNTHSLRSHCSIRRWQYWKAFSLKRSFGGSSRLEEEVAETMETTDPSTSDRSSAAGEEITNKRSGLREFQKKLCIFIITFCMRPFKKTCGWI